MPDFDQNLNPIIKDQSMGRPEEVYVKAPQQVDPMDPGRSILPAPTLSQGDEDIFTKLRVGSTNSKFEDKGGVFVTNAELNANKRYEAYNPTLEDQEDFYAQRQGFFEKGKNGILKGANLAATTIAGGFGMVGGLVYSAHSGRLADIWDNDFMRALDGWNEKVDNEYLPNYYKKTERDAKWYEMNNWMTGNFLFDKLVKNSGFAVGAMLSGNIANAALGAAGAALGTGAMGLAGAAEASQAFKLFSPLLRNMARGFSAAKNIEVAAAMEKGLSSMADIEAASSEIANIAKTTNQFAKFGDAAKRTAIAAYSSAGEAAFEALQTSKEHRNSLIEQYKISHAGNEPTGAELKTIEEESDSVGKVSFFGNLALLGATEYVQLGKLLGSSYAAEKQAANSLMGKADDVILKEGKYVGAAKAPTTRFGKMYTGVAKASQYVYDPKEMGQELGQYALQVGTQNYFRKAKETDDASMWTDGFLYGMFGHDKTGKGEGALVSKEGIEGGIMGGLTGGLMQARSTYTQGKAVKTNTGRLIEALNQAPTFRDAFVDKLGGVNRGIVLQQQQEQATIQGDQLEARDLNTDMMHNYLAPRIKYGRYGMIEEDMKELRESARTKKGFAELQAQGIAGINDTVESFEKKVTSIENHAKNVEELYKSTNLRYGGEVLKDSEGNEVKSPDGKSKMRKYSPLVIDKMVYAASKVADYDLRIPQVNGPLAAAGINTQDVLQDIIEGNQPNLQAAEKALQDINALNIISEKKDKLKINLSDAIELSLRRQSFMQEYDDIKANPLNYETDPAYAVGEREEMDVTVTQFAVPEGKKNRKNVEKPLEVGRQYSTKEPLRNDNGDLTLAPKMTVLSQTLGGEFEVRMPNGKIKFLTPSEFKEYALTEEDNAFEGNEDMLHEAFKTILNKPRFSDEKAAMEKGKFKDLASKLFVLRNSGNLALANAIEAEFNRMAEKLMKEKAERAAREALYRKNKEEWEKAQASLILRSASTPGIDTSEVNNPSEEARKDEQWLFKATTTESEKNEDPLKSEPHVKRSRVFLNKVDDFPNRGDMKVVLVHAGNAKSMGLEGIVELSYKGAPPTDANHVETGFLAQVYTVQVGNKTFYVDQNGEIITQVGDPKSKDRLDEIVFQTMPTTSTTYSNGAPRHRAEQKAEAEYQSKSYALFRKDLWAAGDTISDIHDFWVSRGFAKTNPGAREHNHVGGILINEDKIANTEGLITIPTEGTVQHQGRNLKFPNGVPVLKYGSRVTFLNNRLITANESQALFKAIEAVTDTVKKQMEKGEPIRPESEEFTFIQSLLYWTKGETKKENQITINDDMQLAIGDLKIPLTEVSQNEALITAQLQKGYLTTNNKNLSIYFREAFPEFYVDSAGALQKREWKNYQSYLLSSKYPDGSARKAKDTPLTTNIAVPTEAVPNAFEQKYSVLEDVDFPIPAGGPPPQGSGTGGGTGPLKVGDHTIDGVTPNNITFQKDGPLKGKTAEFTATLEGEQIAVVVTGGDAIEAVANNRAMDAEVRNALTISGQLEDRPEEESPEDYLKRMATLYLSNSISAKLTHDYTEQKKQGGPPPGPPSSTLTVEQEIARAENLYRDIINGKIAENKLPIQDKILIDAISAERKAEIKAEEDAKKGPPSGGTTAKPDVTANDVGKIFNKGKKYRVFGFDGKERSTDIDLDLFKEWAEKNVPNIPYEVLENIITTVGGEKAWGVFEDGVAKFVRGGLRGTEYHEIGEAIWNGMLSFDEQQEILLDERNKKGIFVDRESGKRYRYSDDSVSDDMLKERILDDFSDFRLGKLPSRSLGESIKRFFKRIMDFFKSFVMKPSRKQEFFDAIDTGKFKGAELKEEAKTMAPEYRKVEGLSQELTHLMTQDMLARASGYLFGTGQKYLLYNPVAIESKELFDIMRQEYEDEREGTDPIILDYISDTAWQQLQVRVKDALRATGAAFVGEEEDINHEDSNKNDYMKDTFAPQGKESSSRAVKFNLSTQVEREATNQEKKPALKLPPAQTTKIGGYKLMDFNKTFTTLLDKLSNTTDINKYVQKLVALASSDANYVSFFQRNGGSLDNKDMPFKDFSFNDWRFFIDNWQTFTKQKPGALIQYKTMGEVYTGSASLFGAVKMERNKWSENLKVIAKSKKGLIKYNWETKTYNVDKVELLRTEKVGNKDIKVYDVNIPTNMVSFLQAMGIEFPMTTYKKLRTKAEAGKKSSQQDMFAEAVNKIYTYVSKAPEVMSLDGKVLGINTSLNVLGELYVKVMNPNQDPTFFGVDGKQQGSYADNNVSSIFENEFNESATRDELLEKRPELRDVFSEHSQILKLGGMFFDESGNRIREIKVNYIQGDKDIDNNKGTSTSKLGLGDRFSQAINQNLRGDYYVLIPADGTTEWMMDLGNPIDFKLFDDKGSNRAWTKVYEMFNGYLKDDINLARDSHNRAHLVHVKNRATELRFFKDILSGKAEYDEVLKGLNDMIASADATTNDIKEYADNNIDVINAAVYDFVNNIVNETTLILRQNEQISPAKGENLYQYLSLDDKFAQANNIKKEKMSEGLLNNVLTFARVNYIINNIEYHKILFGDPFQFQEKDGKLDQTKRVKSSLSPRRTTFDHPEFNNFLNNNMNTVAGVELSIGKVGDVGDPGAHEFDSFTTATVLKNHEVYGSLAAINPMFGNTDESDAFSWLMDNTYREIKIKNKQWGDQAEAWHQWQMAYTRQAMAKAKLYSYDGKDALRKHDANLISRPAPKHKIEILKPIITGNKHGLSRFEIMLHKTSQMPIYYSMVEGTNMEKLYIKMLKQKIGYAIVQSGAKVGVEDTHATYNPDGTFNEEPFNNILKVPWKTYGIQQETTAEGEKQQPRGSQLTKMASMDLFSDGEVIGDTPERQEYIKKEYEKNKEILDRMHENAYKELLNDLGVEDMGDDFVMKDGRAVSETLMKQMMRRVVSDNTKDTIQLDENNQFKIPFEASPSYNQIRSILYSMVEKAILSPKMHGGAHVQAAVSMFEDAKEGRRLAEKIKNPDGTFTYKRISIAEYESLPKDRQANVRMTDDTLRFYVNEDGKRHCEIMVPHWFKDKFPKEKGESERDHEKRLLKYLNSKEGRDILTGIGFRIPTQSLSSVEVFRVKGFLPQYMGSTVVVPSEITTKAGSDFDIDKLNMYLKAVYVDTNGQMRVVNSHGSEMATKLYYSNVFEGVHAKKIERLTNSIDVKRLINIFKKIEGIEENELTDESIEGALVDRIDLDIYYKNQETINQIMDLADEKDMYASDYLAKLTDKNIVAKLKADFVKDMYKKSIENDYYRSLENLLTLPEVFDRLIKPVDDAGLSKVADRLDVLRGEDETKIKNRILDPNYMTKLRHAFVIGKKWVAVAAVNITNLSLKQKSKVYIDDYFEHLSPSDQQYLGDGRIQLNHNTVYVDGQPRVSLSGSKVAEQPEVYISDRYSGYATSFVDVAKDPFILKIIQSDLVIGTIMFLENIGAGEQTAFFLNQPIIAEYLKMLDGKGGKTLFNRKNIEAIRAKFGIGEEHMQLNNGDIDPSRFESNIETFYKRLPDIGSNEFKAEQSNVLDEFLKYGKMASFAFKFARATNYDTSRVTNAEHFARKEWETEAVMEKNIISSVKNILETTHIGRQKELLGLTMNAMGAVMKLEDRKMRYVTERVLKPYATKEFMASDTFNRIANKLKASFLDFIIQSKGAITPQVYDLVVNGETALVTELERLKQVYPENELLRDLTPVTGERPNGAKSISLSVNTRQAYDENRYVGMMEELKDSGIKELQDFYKNLITVSIIQGSSPSAISIKNIIPIDDYAAIVAPIMSQIVADPSMDIFPEGFLFEKNNFQDPDIVPEVIPHFRRAQQKVDGQWEELEPVGYDQYENEIYQYRSSSFKEYKTMNIAVADRKIFLLSEKFNSSEVEHDIIKLPRIFYNKENDERVDLRTGKTITSKHYSDLKKAGDPNLKSWYGYQKVRYANGRPLTHYAGEYEGVQHVYKLINLYGDGMRATEYPVGLGPSVIENGTVKIDNEIPDSDIVDLFGGELPLLESDNYDPRKDKSIQKPGAPIFNSLPYKSDTPTMTYAGIGSRQTPADIQAQMTEVARILDGRGYTLRSGGAEGADQAFEKGATKKEVFLGTEPAGDIEHRIAREIHPNPKALDNSKSPEFVWNLMARNTNQVFGKDLKTTADFVLAWTPDGLENHQDRTINSGGTGQAIEMASRKGIPVINMANPNWRIKLDDALNKVQEKKETPEETPEEEPFGKGPEHKSILETRTNPLDYTNGQTKALFDIEKLIDANKQGYYLLAGYAGTGKTTIAENIARYAQQMGKGVSVLAPTNKAAKVLSDKLKAAQVPTSPSTIHKAIYGEPDENGDWIVSANIKDSVIIIDEASMISTELMADLISATKKNNVLIFMGDSYQLEPVGEDSGLFKGNVSEVANSQTELTEVKRQALDSNILAVATLARTDNKPYIPSQSIKDFTITPSKNDFITNFKKSIKSGENSVMIVATNNERIYMNKAARDAKWGASQTPMHNGEVLISVANSTDFQNSEVYTVEQATEITSGPQTISISFPNETKEYNVHVYETVVDTPYGKANGISVMIPQLDKPSLYHAQLLKGIKANPTLREMFRPYIFVNKKNKEKLSPDVVINTYGYAITAHKSQGSQWDKVYVNQNYNADSWNPGRWFYTAITRAANEVEVFPTAVNVKIPSNEIQTRINAIATRTESVYDTFEDLNEFTAEQKEGILTTFAEKYKMSRSQATNYINDALKKDKDGVIEKLKECY